jgi:hypothetical protein
MMKRLASSVVLSAVLAAGVAAAQETTKPVPKDSMRVMVPGCTKGMVFTAGPRREDQPGRADIPEGTHLRMSAPKKMINEIKAHEGTMIEITGLIKRGQMDPEGVRIGPGVHVTPGPSPIGGNLAIQPTYGQVIIDLESWRPATGSCRN